MLAPFTLGGHDVPAERAVAVEKDVVEGKEGGGSIVSFGTVQTWHS